MKRKPQTTAEIMRPEHPRWPNFYSRLRELLTAEADGQATGEFSLTVGSVLTEMGFSQFDIELTMLYLFKRWAMAQAPSQPIEDQYDNS
jgi:hypothetical protein